MYFYNINLNTQYKLCDYAKRIDHLIKHIKYLISLLLIFCLTVNECSLSSQTNSTKYHQVTYVNTKNLFSNKFSKCYPYGRKNICEKIFLSLFFYINVTDVYNTQVSTILKLQNKIYEKINSIILQHIFLNKIITTNNTQVYTQHRVN